MEIPKSPLCPDSLVTLVDEVSGERLSSEWQRQLGIEIPPSFCSHTVFRLWRCTRSQLRFITPSMPGDGDFYARLRAFDQYYCADKWEYRAAINWTRGGGRLLDVGCGDGAFVQMAVEKGFESEGLELNSSAVAHAQAKGLKVWARMPEAHAERIEFTPYDVVSSFQVLEHVHEPMTFLKSLITMIKPGGRLVIGVPNCDGWAGATGGVLQWPPHHLTWWGGASLVYLQQILPLRLVALEFEPLRDEHKRDYVTAFLHPALVPKAVNNGLFKRIANRTLCEMAMRLIPARAEGHTVLAVYERTEATGVRS